MGQAVRAVDPKFDVTAWLVFLYVAKNPGTGSASIVKELDLSQSTLSRTVIYLSNLPNGLNLIAMEPNPEDRRQHRLYLTEKGEAFLKSLRKIIGG